MKRNHDGISQKQLSRSQFLKLSGGALSAALAGGALSACGGTVSAGGSQDQGSGSAAPDTNANDKALNLYTWQEYVPPKVVEGFEQETGITINYSYFSTCEEMLAKLEATKGADYDVILCTDYIIKTAADEGLLQTIDTSKLENYKNVDPRLEGQYFDPDSNLSIPYWISQMAIFYDPSKTSLGFQSFAELADESLKGQVVMDDGERGVIGTAIETVGGDYNTQDVDEINSCKDFLEKLRPNIEAFNTDSPEFVVSNGDATACFTTGAQCIAGLIADDSLAWNVPKESTAISIDAFVVPSKAPHLDNVYTFLDYVLRGDVAATAVEHTHYHNSNISDEFKKDVKQYVDEDRVAVIPDSTLDDYVLTETLGTDAQQAYDDLWTAFKQG